jgi:predicted lipid-binding transport protein (Tim44 family)
MKRTLIHLCLLLAALSAGLTSMDADARRLGGGSSSGMRRSLPPARPATPPQQLPAQQQAARTPPSTPPVAPVPPRRSWLGPIAGIAAGLGLAALFSHLGFGPAIGEFMTLLLLAVVAIAAVRFVLRRVAGTAPRPATAAAGAGTPRMAWGDPVPQAGGPSVGTASTLAAVPGSQGVEPVGFDRAAFERTAKQIFIRLQAANDAGDLDDLRRFTTPEMYAAVRLDLQERAGAAQRTDVVQLAAEVLDTGRDDGRDVVSVRYHGLIREVDGGAAEPFDEVWHLVRADGTADWRIAGIQQTA